MTTLHSRAAVLVQAERERTRPVRVRSEAQVRGAGSTDRRRFRGAPTIGDLGQSSAKPLVARVDRPLAAGLRVLDHEEADVRQPQLARVDYLDGDDLAPAGKPCKRRAPGVDGCDEVRDHDREAATSQDVSETIDGTAEIDLSAER